MHKATGERKTCIRRYLYAFFLIMGTNNITWYVQCRLPATVRCVSHPSAHVRALSTSVLRAILHAGSLIPKSKLPHINKIHNPRYQQYLNKIGTIDWQADVEKCLTWEAHSRIATGLPIQFVDSAAKELGCAISV